MGENDEPEAGNNGDDKLEDDNKPGVQKVEEVTPGSEDEETLPAYLGEAEPAGEEDRAKFWLLKGLTDEEVVAKGLNSGTVRIARSHLIRDGYTKKEHKPPKDIGKDLATTGRSGAKEIQVFAKGSPPEALIESMSFPLVDGETKGFEHGMKFGASMVVLGVRIAQELSAVGIQQAKPLIEMARDMRAGEAAIAKSAATDAALMAAAQVQENLMPLLAGLDRTPSGADPMRGMMTRVMEPVLKNMMSRLIPGMSSEPAAGWTKKSE